MYTLYIYAHMYNVYIICICAEDLKGGKRVCVRVCYVCVCVKVVYIIDIYVHIPDYIHL